MSRLHSSSWSCLLRRRPRPGRRRLVVAGRRPPHRTAPTVANAYSTMGSSTQDLPLGPTAALQFATCYVNLAVPSSAGRIASTTRFFQRFGIPLATALSAGLIDSLSELRPITLRPVFLSRRSRPVGQHRPAQWPRHHRADRHRRPRARRRHRPRRAVPARQDEGVSRSGPPSPPGPAFPRKVLQLYGGNLLAQILLAVTLGACTQAFGYPVPLSTLILINSVVSLFAGLLPVPGGIGVTEAGLSLGLTRAGVPSETAFAIALTYRFTTFYLPPIWGYASYRWLSSRRYV